VPTAKVPTAPGRTEVTYAWDTVEMQFPRFAIGVAKVHEMEIFEITTLMPLIKKSLRRFG